MRIVYFLFLLIVPFLSFSASEKPVVVATASMIWDMTRHIGGDAVDIRMIVPIGGVPHLHEPTPRDARLVSEADLVLKNGLTFEGWLNELIENSGTLAEVVTVTNGIDAIASDQYENSADPHAWMTAENGILYSENIKNALVKLLPEQEDSLEIRFQIYKELLEQTEDIIKKEIQRIPKERRILITSHDAFQYYGRHYGLRLESVLGTSTDADVQTGDIRRLNELIRQENVPAVFIESTVNPKLLRQIASDNNIKVGGKLFADSIGDSDSAAPTYVDMLLYNTRTIVEALTAPVTTIAAHKDQDDNSPSLLFVYLLLGVLLLVLMAWVGIKLVR